MDAPYCTMSFDRNLSTRDQKSLPFGTLPTAALSFRFFAVGSVLSSSISEECADPLSGSSVSGVSDNFLTSSLSRIKRR